MEYRENYSKRSGSLLQYCEDMPAVNSNGDIADFNGANWKISITDTIF